MRCPRSAEFFGDIAYFLNLGNIGDENGAVADERRNHAALQGKYMIERKQRTGSGNLIYAVLCCYGLCACKKICMRQHCRFREAVLGSRVQ